MTTVAIQGIKLTYTNSTVTSVSQTQALVTVPSSTTTFSYTIDPGGTDPFPMVDISSVYSQVILDNQLMRVINETSSVDASLGRVAWTGGTSTILGLTWETGPNTTTDLYFVLDGAALPNITTPAEWDAFDKSIGAVGQAVGDFAPGKNILWTEFDFSTVTEDDEFYGTSANETFEGGIGDDYFVSSEGNDTYRGGAGFDQVAFHLFDPAGVTANLRTGTATDGWGDTDKLFSIEMLRGSNFDDVLTGNGGRNVLRGLGGDDILNGLKGRDEVRYDRDARYGGTDGVTVNLKKGTATDGFGDTDTLRNFEDVRGSDFNDRITGSGGKNKLDGMAGNDVLIGLGNDDILIGGLGRDRLIGGNGDDTLEGGGGNDRFIFKAKFGDDTIVDFRTAGKGEKIDLSGVKPIKGFKDLKNNHLSEVNGDAMIDDGNGNTITLDGVAMADLSFNDFLF